MALTKKTASHHNLKRAEVFKSHGINDWDAKYAHPHFEGKDGSIEGGTCSLCGQQHLLWLYSIKFDAPDITVSLGAITKGISRTAEVVFNPVGSVCINDWLDALPESAEKLQLLQRWKIEMDKERKAKAVQAIENALKKNGLGDEATAIKRFNALTNEQCEALDWYSRKALASIGRRIQMTALAFKKRWRSVKTANYFASLLKKAEDAPKLGKFGVPLNEGGEEDYQKLAELESEAIGAAESEMAAIEPTTGGKQAQMFAPKTETEILLERGRDVFRDKTKLARLSQQERDALADMGKKLAHFKSFVSSNQRGFFLKLVERAEGQVNPAEADAAVLVARAKAVLADPTKLGSLNTWEKSTITDITKKVEQHKTFYSDNQRGLFMKLIEKGETGAEPQRFTAKGVEGAESDAAALASGPQPGDAEFTSASKLVGARY